MRGLPLKEPASTARAKPALGGLGCSQFHGHGAKHFILHGAATRVIAVAAPSYAQRPPRATGRRWPGVGASAFAVFQLHPVRGRFRPVAAVAP